ncbi:hypothetical protein BKM16_20620 [Pseudomonas amygdali pv. morsprunorum]|nr:hypothetical protein BKM22_20660 [Pseudomonas amygdali pv. morsprunorum]POD41987.1 hypothetical protein BKM16_20620 [Pseudomonas amygdali pv. morsprunorum]POD44622.1 hypothetical protein BKM02_20040 [Pseudomonas amygdali pv. morsprunorum]
MFNHPATLKRQIALTKLFTLFYRVGNKNQGHAVILQSANSLVAFALELFVPHSEHFVSQQNLWLNMNRHRKTQGGGKN